MDTLTNPITTRTVTAHGIEINVATAGSGAALLLLHGFPHTWELWSRIIPTLAETHFVIAPDLRGTGGSTRAATGYDVASLSADVLGLLDALDVDQADVVAIDAGAPVAFYFALLHPERVGRLVLMEANLGDLPRPGAPAASPWWFGFHAVPGLAETVVEGHEDEYIGFFLDSGMSNSGMTAGGMTPALRSTFIDSYRGKDSLRTGFEYYRSMGTNARQINEALEHRRLTVSTMAIGANPVGAGLYAQLQPITDNLVGELIGDSGHIIPLDQPSALLALIGPFLAAADRQH